MYFSRTFFHEEHLFWLLYCHIYCSFLGNVQARKFRADFQSILKHRNFFYSCLLLPLRTQFYFHNIWRTSELSKTFVAFIQIKAQFKLITEIKRNMRNGLK